MAEIFFARLPPSRLTASETELRDCLLRAAAVADRLLPRTGAVSLSAWVNRRIPGQVTLSATRDGHVTLAAGEATAAAAEAARPPRAGAPAAPVPKAPPGGAPGGLPAGGSSAAAEAFFGRLPADAFTPSEEALRAALKALLAERGPLTVSQAAAHPEVASAAKATLIRAVTLADWAERRIGSEVQAVTDERGARVLQLARQNDSREERREAFFSQLPDGRFTAEEEALRSALIDFLATWKSAELATLSNAGTDKGVQWAKGNLFRGFDKAVTMREWIERRIGGELELQMDAKGQQVIHVTAAARNQVAARFRELERQGAAPPKGKGKGPDDRVGQKGAVIPAAGSAQVGGKGKGAAKGAITNGPPAALPKADRDAIRKRLFGNLPRQAGAPRAGAAAGVAGLPGRLVGRRDRHILSSQIWTRARPSRARRARCCPPRCRCCPGSPRG
ncbi:unnamed protein product [Prorocentrum cordatum]|uniref:Uncharacterized protein n=1 Tax=Prorocentrum cordatum TaxID=2364126 RepID=A0ABN9X393_9DINO|nr:unnamed protein product [Polarella glacialis]